MIPSSIAIGDTGKMLGSTQKMVSVSGSRVGRRQINHEKTMARFPEGTLDRIKAVLEDGEPQSEFIREAVERELKRREG